MENLFPCAIWLLFVLANLAGILSIFLPSLHFEDSKIGYFLGFIPSILIPILLLMQKNPMASARYLLLISLFLFVSYFILYYGKKIMEWIKEIKKQKREIIFPESNYSPPVSEEFLRKFGNGIKRPYPEEK